jgi:hypothetical protein
VYLEDTHSIKMASGIEFDLAEVDDVSELQPGFVALSCTTSLLISLVQFHYFTCSALKVHKHEIFFQFL